MVAFNEQMMAEMTNLMREVQDTLGRMEARAKVYPAAVELHQTMKAVVFLFTTKATEALETQQKPEEVDFLMRAIRIIDRESHALEDQA